jgi:hypothetical protein
MTIVSSCGSDTGVPAKDVPPPGVPFTTGFGFSFGAGCVVLPKSEHPLTIIHNSSSSEGRKKFFECIFIVPHILL